MYFDRNIRKQNLQIQSEQKHISVKGKLKQKYEFWQNTMKTNETILQIIDQGYMLTFFEKPSEAKFRSGLTNLTNLTNSL